MKVEIDFFAIAFAMVICVLITCHTFNKWVDKAYPLDIPNIVQEVK